MLRLCVFCPAYLLKHIRDFGVGLGLESSTPFACGQARNGGEANGSTNQVRQDDMMLQHAGLCFSISCEVPKAPWHADSFSGSGP